MDNKIIVGSIESGDLMIVATENHTSKNTLNLQSKFLKQYKNEITQVINDTCQQENIVGLDLDVNDQGAIPAVIRARVKSVGREYEKLKNKQDA